MRRLLVSLLCFGGLFACSFTPVTVSGDRQSCTRDGVTPCPAGFHCATDSQCWLDGQNPVCPQGTHRCDNECPSNDNVLACGEVCVVCPTIANATTVCAESKCDFACAGGFHRCGDACFANEDASHCGSDCVACPGPTTAGTGEPLCGGGECAIQCVEGRHLCGQECVQNADLANCGRTSCSPCIAPANASSVCDGTACGFVCGIGYSQEADGCVVTPPRPLSPLSTARVASKNPRFVWVMPTGVATVQLQICKDRDCVNVLSSTKPAASGVVAPMALDAGVYYWRLTSILENGETSLPSPTWELFVQTNNVANVSGRAFGFVPDFDGDGTPDFAVGAAQTSAVFVYRGDRTSIVISPEYATVRSSDASTRFGQSVATGDFNGDGYSDLAVGGAQTIDVYAGGAGGMTAPWHSFDVDNAGDVACLGDVDGDGYADLMYVTRSNPFSVAVRYGAPDGLTRELPLDLSTQAQGDVSSLSLASAGDVNGDGYADAVVGAWWRDSLSGDSGRGAAVFFGSQHGLVTTAVTLPPPATGDFGDSVGSADVNGDGYSEVLVGAPCRMGCTIASVYVYLGGTSAADAMPLLQTLPDTGGAAGSEFGTALANAGDLNNDGYGDVIVGSPSQTRVYLYLGGSTGLTVDSGNDVVCTSGAAPCDQFGAAVAGVGDINGDRFDDVVVGAPSATVDSVQTGAAYIYYKEAAAPSRVYQRLVPSAASTVVGFGCALGSL